MNIYYSGTPIALPLEEKSYDPLGEYIKQKSPLDLIKISSHIGEVLSHGEYLYLPCPICMQTGEYEKEIKKGLTVYAYSDLRENIRNEFESEVSCYCRRNKDHNMSLRDLLDLIEPLEHGTPNIVTLDVCNFTSKSLCTGEVDWGNREYSFGYLLSRNGISTGVYSLKGSHTVWPKHDFEYIDIDFHPLHPASLLARRESELAPPLAPPFSKALLSRELTMLIQHVVSTQSPHENETSLIEQFKEIMFRKLESNGLELTE